MFAIEEQVRTDSSYRYMAPFDQTAFGRRDRYAREDFMQADPADDFDKMVGTGISPVNLPAETRILIVEGEVERRETDSVLADSKSAADAR